MTSLAPLTVRQAMENKVVFIEGSRTVADAIEVMADKNVWSLIVTRSDMPVGVLTERDVIRRCYSKGLNPSVTRLESVMSSPIITIEPDSSLGEAMTLMEQKNIRRVYVVERGKIIGRITQTGAFGRMLNVMMALSSVL